MPPQEMQVRPGAAFARDRDGPRIGPAVPALQRDEASDAERLGGDRQLRYIDVLERDAARFIEHEAHEITLFVARLGHLLTLSRRTRKPRAARVGPQWSKRHPTTTTRKTIPKANGSRSRAMQAGCARGSAEQRDPGGNCGLRERARLSGGPTTASGGRGPIKKAGGGSLNGRRLSGRNPARRRVCSNRPRS